MRLEVIKNIFLKKKEKSLRNIFFYFKDSFSHEFIFKKQFLIN